MQRNISRIYSAGVASFLAGPKSMAPGSLEAFVQLLSSRDALAAELKAIDGERYKARLQALTMSSLADGSEWWFDERLDAHIRPSGVAVIPVSGVLMAEQGWCWQGFDSIERSVLETVSDVRVKAILMPIRSPGGDARVSRVCQVIREAGNVKPIITHVQLQACSSGQAIAASGTQAFLSRQAETGHTGVYYRHEDVSAMLRNDGIEVRYLQSSPDKAFFATEIPLTDANAAIMQRGVDFYYGLYAEAIALGRGLEVDYVRGLQARIHYGAEGIAAKLYDAHPGNEDGCIDWLDLLAKVEDGLGG